MESGSKVTFLKIIAKRLYNILITFIAITFIVYVDQIGKYNFLETEIGYGFYVSTFLLVYFYIYSLLQLCYVPFDLLQHYGIILLDRFRNRKKEKRSVLQ